MLDFIFLKGRYILWQDQAAEVEAVASAVEAHVEAASAVAEAEASAEVASAEEASEVAHHVIITIITITADSFSDALTTMAADYLAVF